MYSSKHQLSFHSYGKPTCHMASHDHPAEVWIPPLPQTKQVLDLATLEGCKAELTYVTWKRTSWDLNPRPVNHKSNALPQCQRATKVKQLQLLWRSSHLFETFLITHIEKHSTCQLGCVYRRKENHMRVITAPNSLHWSDWLVNSTGIRHKKPTVIVKSLLLMDWLS